MQVDYIIYNRFILSDKGEYMYYYKIGEEPFDGFHSGTKVSGIKLINNDFAEITFENGEICFQKNINAYGTLKPKQDAGEQTHSGQGNP